MTKPYPINDHNHFVKKGQRKRACPVCNERINSGYRIRKRQLNKVSREKNIELTRAKIYQYKKLNREKVRVHSRVERAIRSGRLIRREFCQFCGIKDNKMLAHHYDYSKPYDVVWVCPSCHKKIHNKLRAEEVFR